MNQAKYIGMDVHQSTTVVAVLNADGRVVWETIVTTQAGPIIDLLESLSGSLHVKALNRGRGIQTPGHGVTNRPSVSTGWDS